MTSPSPGTAPTRGQTAGRGHRRRAAEIDVDEARKAFFLMVGFIALIWILQIANWADHYRLDASYGILPRSLGHLGDIFTAPFLHFSWEHIEGNSGPLFVFGLLAAYRGVVKFLGVTLVVAITSGLAVWLFQSNGELTVGASGLIFGYFGYVLTRGIIEQEPHRRARRGRHRAVLRLHPDRGDPGCPRRELDRPPRRPGRRASLAAGSSAPAAASQPGPPRPTPRPARASPSMELQVTQGHPRADLYKELGDLGL